MSGVIPYAVGVLTLVGFYAIVAMLLNLQAGWGGLWDLGLGGLLGAGGYFFVLAMVPAEGNETLLFTPGWPMWLAIVGAGLFTALVAFLIGLPALRLRGEYFLIVTFAFAEMIRQLIVTEPKLANGTVGFTELQRPLAGSFAPNDYKYFLLALITALVVLTYLLMRRIGHSPYGRLLRSMRDNEALALALGKQVMRRRTQLRIFVGLLFGLAAPLYIWHIRAIVPAMYGPDITFTTWTVLVVGGIGSVAGGVVGALVLVGMTEALLFIPVSTEHVDLLGGSKPFLLGLALIVMLRLRPDGVIPERWTFRDKGGRVAEGAKKRLKTVVGT
jgi:branched-chain amino acid transport system permease protein